ncbi:MAG: hypothetical protein LBR10_06950 [Prevotellaceae bacterium]|jgi:hypothetical protein|nr:hypothetical protein [Prevotellaceae bacterium]
MFNNELKKNPFATPADYFDNLPTKIQNRCIVAKKRQKTGFVPKIVFAGGIAVLMFALFLSYLTTDKENSGVQTADILPVDNQEQSPLENYLKTTSKKIINQDAMIDYIASRNVNIDYMLLAKFD